MGRSEAHEVSPIIISGPALATGARFADSGIGVFSFLLHEINNWITATKNSNAVGIKYLFHI